jgi:hypothetical protein
MKNIDYSLIVNNLVVYMRMDINCSHPLFALTNIDAVSKTTI